MKPTGRDFNHASFLGTDRVAQYLRGYARYGMTIRVNNSGSHGLHFSLNRSELGFLNLLKDLLQAEKHIGIRGEKAHLSLVSEQVHQDLFDHGWVMNSQTCPDNLMTGDHHFLRGMIDSIGSFGVYQNGYLYIQLQFSGAYSLQEQWVIQQLRSIGLPQDIKTRENSRVINIAGSYALRLCEFLYEDSKDLRRRKKWLTYSRVKKATFLSPIR